MERTLKGFNEGGAFGRGHFWINDWQKPGGARGDPPSREEIDTFGTLAEDEDPWPPRMQLRTATGRTNLSFFSSPESSIRGILENSALET